MKREHKERRERRRRRKRKATRIEEQNWSEIARVTQNRRKMVYKTARKKTNRVRNKRVNGAIRAARAGMGFLVNLTSLLTQQWVGIKNRRLKIRKKRCRFQ